MNKAVGLLKSWWAWSGRFGAIVLRLAWCCLRLLVGACVVVYRVCARCLRTTWRAVVGACCRGWYFACKLAIGVASTAIRYWRLALRALSFILWAVAGWLHHHRLAALCLFLLAMLALWSLALALAIGIVLLVARLIGRTLRRGLSPGWVVALLLLCWVLRFFAVVALRYGYDMLYDQDYLRQLAVREIGKLLKPELRGLVKPPRFIDISLRRRAVTVYDLQLPDTGGESLVKVAKLEVVWQRLLPTPRLAAVTIDAPELLLQCDAQGRFNCAVLDVAKPSAGKTFILPTSLPSLRLSQGVLTLRLPRAGEPWQERISFDFAVLPDGRNQYNIAGQLSGNLVKKIHFAGRYRPGSDGLFVYCQPFSVPLDGISEVLPYKPWQIGGVVTVERTVFAGGSRQNPEPQLESRISLAQGSIRYGDNQLPLGKVEANVEVRGGKLCGIFASVAIDEGKLSVHNGRVTPAGQIYLPFRLSHFTPGPRLLPLLTGATGLPCQTYWDLLRPHAVIDIDGVLARDAGGDWQWEAMTQVREGFAEYRQIRLEKLQLAVACDHQGMRVDQGEWELQQGYFRIKPGSRLQWHTQAMHADAELEFHRLAVDRGLWAKIPEAADVWEALSPEGLVSGRATLHGDPLTQLPEVEVRAERFTAAFYEIPYPARNVSGRMTWKDDCMHLHDVRGETVHGGAPFQLYGKVWLKEAPFAIAYDVNIQVRDVVIDHNLYRAFTTEEWHEDIRDVWHELDLRRGKVAVSARVHRPRKSPFPPTFHVRVNAGGAAACYREFPYAVEDVRGLVVATPSRILLSRMKARKGPASLEVNGRLTPQPVGLKAEIRVDATRIPLDQDLRATLPDEYQKVWDDFSPQGNLDIEVVARKERRGQPLEWRALASIYEASGRYREFPYPVDHIAATIVIAPNRFHIRNLLGRQQQARVEVHGTIAPEKLELRINGREVAIDKTLENALPAEVRAIADNFSLRGNIDGDILLRRRQAAAKPGAALEWQAQLSFRDLAGFYRPFPYALENVTGRLDISPGGFQLSECKGTSEGGNVSLQCEQQKGQPMSLYIRGTNVALTSKLCAVLSKPSQQMWYKLSPSGRVDVDFTLRGEPEATYRLHVRPRGCDVAYQGFPYRLRQLFADADAGVEITPRRVVFRDIQRRSLDGEQTLTINGNWYEDANNGQSRFSLAVQARQLAVDDNLLQALSHKFPKLAKSLANTGKVEDLEWQMQIFQGGQDYVQYDVAVRGARVPLKKGGFFQELAGDFALRGMAHGSNYHAEGRLDNGELQFYGFCLRNISTPCKLFSDYLVLTPVRATLYDGDVQGWLSWDTTSYNAYQGFFSVSGTQLAGIAEAFGNKADASADNPASVPPKPPMQGLLRSEFSFQGNTYGVDSLLGKGWLQVEKGELLRLPVLLAIFDILSLPERPAFREAELNFTLAKRQCEISGLRLHSSLLSISGEGTIAFDGKLNLRLLTHLAPRYLPRIPIVDQIWDTIKKEFFELSVSGTLDAPSISLMQLQKIVK